MSTSSSSSPVPAPRLSKQTDSNNKRPIPTPRRLVPIRAEQEQELKEDDEEDNIQEAFTMTETRNNNRNSEVQQQQRIKPIEINTNTFTRKVKTISSASKQIAEDIGGRVQEGKKAVIETTRQSVRRLTRRFHSQQIEDADDKTDSGNDKRRSVVSEAELDLFNSIKFNSPLNNSVLVEENLKRLKLVGDDERIYVNCERDDGSCSEENLEMPPPTYPPPPLREEISSFYDQPQSLTSGSTNSSDNVPVFTNRSCDYESVFPIYPIDSTTNSNKNDNDSNGRNPTVESSLSSSIDNNISNSDLSRSHSWNFYDSIPKNENLYDNFDSTPAMTITHELNVKNLNENDDKDVTDDNESNVASDCFPPSIIRTNSLYENNPIADVSNRFPRVTPSLLMQFDPLTSSNANDVYEALSDDNDATKTTVADLKALEELLQSDYLCNNLPLADYDNACDNWSMSNESELDEYANPPTPPKRYDSLPEDPGSSNSGRNAEASSSPKKDVPKTVTNNNNRQEKTRSQFYTDLSSNKEISATKPTEKPEETTKPFKWLKKTQEVLRRAPDIMRGITKKDDYVLRPILAPKNNLPQKGMLYKITMVENLFGEYGARWCVLECKHLVCYYDNTCENAKETFAMDSILSVQIILDQKYKYK